MHFLELHLKAFGHFENDRLELAREGSGRGLHLIVGPNEAGKSTLLAAIERLLFGFPRGRETYDFEHPPNRLAVGARIGGLGSEPVTYVRRKKGDLLTTGDNLTEVPRTIFANQLDSLTPDQYMRLFGLDQKRLRSGGEEMVRCEGDFARILFAESLGELDRFESVRKGLEKEAAELFKPGARGKANAPLNQLRNELIELSKELKDAATPPETWSQLNLTLAAEIAKRAEIDRESERLKIQLDRYDRLARSAGTIQSIEKRTAEIQALGPLPEITGSTRSDFALAEAEAKAARNAIETAKATIERLNREIGSIRLDEPLLAAADRIAPLARRASAITTARNKLDARAKAIETGLIDVENRLHAIGFDALDPSSLPRIDAHDRQRLDSARDTYVRNEANVAKKAAELDLLTEQLRKAEDELKHAPPRRDVAPIETALSRMSSLQERVSGLETLKKNLHRCQKQLSTKLKSLPRWSGTAADFESVRLPDFEMVRADALRHETARRAFEEAADTVDEVSRDLNLKRAILANRLAQFQIPSPEELTATRQSRDMVWSEIRDRWISRSGKLDDRTGSFTDVELADVFEKHTRDSDRLADLLRDHLETIKLTGECLDIDANLTIFEAQRDSLETAAAAAWDQWVSHFSFLTDRPERVEEMRTWPETVNAIRELTEEQASLEEDIRRIEDEWISCRVELVEPLLPDSSPKDQPFELCRSQLQTLRDSWTDRNRDWSRREKHAIERRTAIEVAREKLEASKSELAESTSEWARLLLECQLPSNVAPSAFEFMISELDQIRRETQRIKAERSQFDSDVREIAAFDAEIDALVNEIRFPAHSSDSAKVAESLQTALNSEREKRRVLESARADSESAMQELAESQSKLTAVMRCITRICEEIGVSDPGDAAERFEMIANRDDLRRKVETDQARLDGMRGEIPMDEWLQAAREYDPGLAQQQVDFLNSKMIDSKSEREAVSKQIFACEARIAAIEASAGKGEALAVEMRRKALFEDTTEQVRRYLKCRLTTKILLGAAEAYRQRMGRQVIDLASRYSNKLSQGSLEGILALESDTGRRLSAVRAESGETQELHQLSEGTRDQLFLALKLAMIRSRLDERQRRGLVPLPVIFDDILVNFDDDRASAAFRLFAELAESTQVIYLTHHRHLETVARNALGEGHFGSHHLSGKNVTNGEKARSAQKSRNTDPDTTFPQLVEDLPAGD